MLFRNRERQDLEQEVRLSAQARAVLESPLVEQFFQVKRRQISEQWAQSPDQDIDGRERLYALNKILNDFERHFTAMIANGEFAAREMEAMDARESVNSNRTLANLTGA